MKRKTLAPSSETLEVSIVAMTNVVSGCRRAYSTRALGIGDRVRSDQDVDALLLDQTVGSRPCRRGRRRRIRRTARPDAPPTETPSTPSMGSCLASDRPGEAGAARHPPASRRRTGRRTPRSPRGARSRIGSSVGLSHAAHKIRTRSERDRAHVHDVCVVTQTPPAPTTTSSGCPSTSIVARTSPGLRIDARHRAVDRARDPDVSEADGDAVRPAPHAGRSIVDRLRVGVEPRNHVGDQGRDPQRSLRPRRWTSGRKGRSMTSTGLARRDPRGAGRGPSRGSSR